MLFQFHQLTLILKLPPGLCFQKVFNSSRCDKKQKLVKSFTIFFRALNEPKLEEQWAFTGFYNWWQTKFYLPSVKARRAVVRSVRRRVYCLNCANSKTFSYFQVSYFLSGVRDEKCHQGIAQRSGNEPMTSRSCDKHSNLASIIFVDREVNLVPSITGSIPL